ncbi:MAG: sulfite oxidase [Chloroflexota bacterium]
MSDQEKWVKDTEPFIKHFGSLETKPEEMGSYITPNSQFFVVNAGNTPRLKLYDYRLTITGNGVEREVELSYGDLLGLPSHTVFCYLECAGNMRHLFEEINGDQLQLESNWTRWRLGGVGMAVWTGVSLKTVLELAGLRDNAFDVNLKGLDQDTREEGINRPIPIKKALDEDTLLATLMNGEPLPADHGFPLRVIVPGWVGTNSVKWLGTITVSTSKTWVHRNRSMYVFKGNSWPPEKYAPAEGGEITLQNIKSSLILPWNGAIQAGRQLIRGVARSPEIPIKAVDWSDDDGGTWQAARLIPPFLPYGWVRFEFEWKARPGKQRLMTRATDEEGNVQPMKIPFNEEGYLFNQVYGHPIEVKA